MKVAIDLSPLSSGHEGRGIGVYTRQLVGAIKTYRPDVEVITSKDGSAGKKADLIHYPFFDPFKTTLPLLKPKPVVVTVHDLIPIRFPKRFPRGIRGELSWRIQKRSLEGASHVVCDSEASSSDVLAFTGVTAAKVSHVYLAPDVRFSREDRGPGTLLKARYHLPERYFLYVGDINWNKNLPGLIEAFAMFVNNRREDYYLVLAGSAFAKTGIPEIEAIRDSIKKFGMDKWVRMPGRIAPEDLPSLYGKAVAYVQPSFWEGFGLPVLEAMASGCPAIVTDNSSLKEIAGPSVMASADEPSTIGEGMETVVGWTDKKREGVISQSVQWASRFTWKRAADETVRIYETVLRGS